MINPIPLPPPLESSAEFARPSPHQSKLSHRKIILTATSVIAALVVGITLLGLKVSTPSTGCGFYCGPETGRRLADSQAFTDTKWGFVVDYSGSYLTINKPDPTSNTADFLALDQNGNPVGEIALTALPATDTASAIKQGLTDFNTSQFQEITDIEAVPGAAIGLLPGVGAGYSANLVSSSGSGSTPVGVVIMAVTHGNTTILAEMWSQTNTSGDAPFYLAEDQSFDNVLTNFHFLTG